MKRLAAALIAMVAASAAAGADLGTKTSRVEEVTIKVTPRSIAPGASAWEFVVVLDTHTKSLNEDLLRSAVLMDDKGVRHAPTAWVGSDPGGRHREGVLRFNALSPVPDVLELQIDRPEESRARLFRWSLVVSGQASDPVRLQAVVEGYRLELKIEALRDPAIAHPQHSAGYEHRVMLTVREPKIDHRVQLESAALVVAERGHPGPRISLEPVDSAAGPAYEAYVRMALTGTYRLEAHARTRGTGRTLSAQFDYRHRH